MQLSDQLSPAKSAAGLIILAPEPVPRDAPSPADSTAAGSPSAETGAADAPERSVPKPLLAMLGRAVQNNPDVQARSAEYRATLADVKSANWQRYPTPSLTSEQSSDGRFNLLRVQQPLYAGGRIDASVANAEALARAKQAQVKEASEQAAIKFIEVYGRYAQSAARGEALRRSVSAYIRLRETILKRVEQGIAAPSELRLTETRLGVLESDLATAEIQTRSLLRQLGQLTGADINPAELPGINFRLGIDRFETAAAATVSRSAALTRAREQESAAAAEIDISRAALRPQIVLRADRQWGAIDDTTVYLAVQAQPGAGLSSLSGTQAAVARREAAREAIRAVERDLVERTDLDYANYQTAAQRSTAARNNVAATRELLRAYERQFVVGKRSWLDVLNMVRELSQADVLAAESAVTASVAAWKIDVRMNGVPEQAL
jgi:adhesin transport system outer membrane protein